jgi:acyl-CoA thioester hydrolase
MSGEPGRVGWATGGEDNDGFRYKVEVQVRFRDLDPMNHVNNAAYFTYFEIARIAYYGELTGSTDPRDLDMILAEATCSYRSPAAYGERLDVWVRTASLGRSSSVFEYRIVEQTTGRLVAIGRTVQVMYDYAAGRPTPMPPELRGRFEAFEGRPLSRTE